MGNTKTVLILVVCVVIAVGTCVVLLPLAVSTGTFETWQLQAQADNANAQANKINAQAELTEEQAALEVAQGERAIAEAQGEALIGAVETSNRLVTLWGVTFPAMPPAYLGIGFFFGLVCGGAAMYAVGLNRALSIAILQNELDSTPVPAVRVR